MVRIVYHPPKAVSHGHGPRARSPRKAWEAVQTFLREQTVAELRLPLKLTVWGPSQWTERVVVEATRSEAIVAFGPPTDVSGEFFNWELASLQQQDALEFALADERRPKQSLGPVRLYMSYAFTWRHMRNPIAVEQPADFARGNYLGVSVGGRRLFIQPTFIYEPEVVDTEFLGELRKLEASMPFVPNERNYYSVEAKKTGQGKKLVKMQTGWTGAL